MEAVQIQVPKMVPQETTVMVEQTIMVPQKQTTMVQTMETQTQMQPKTIMVPQEQTTMDRHRDGRTPSASHGHEGAEADCSEASPQNHLRDH